MKINSLYSVMSYLLKQNPDFNFPGNIFPIEASTRDKKAYYRLELPIEEIQIDEFTLLNAHISIYEYIDPTIPTMSPAHFTAVWQNTDGQHYRMHIFLNDNDTLSCEPTWDINEDKGTYRKASMPECADALVQNLWQQALPCLQKLREEKSTLIKSLESQYNALEKEAATASAQFRKHPETYLACLARTEEPLTLLIKLSANSYWGRVLSYIQNIQKHVISVAAPAQRVSPSAGKEEQPATQMVSNAAASSLTLFSQHNARTPKNSHPLRELQGLYQQVLDTANKSQKASLLFSLHQKLLILNDGDLSLISVTQLQELAQLEKEVDRIGKGLLQTALIESELGLALELYPFFNSIHPDIVNLALIRRNSELLIFLMKYLDYPVNSHPVVIAKKRYTNALSYCFLEHGSAPALSECFTALVANGANLILPASDGQPPMGYLILSTGASHPLYGALEKNAELTLKNKMFYRQLISRLQNYLKHSQLDEIQQLDINKAIGAYEEQITQLALSHNLFTPAINELNDELIKTANKMLGKALITQLYSDPDIKRMGDQIERQIKSYFTNMKTFKRKTGRNFCSTPLVRANMEDLLASLQDLNLPADLDLVDVKKESLSMLRNVSKMFELCGELMEVQAKIFCTPALSGKRNKGQKKLLQRQDELLGKLKVAEKELPQNLINKSQFNFDPNEMMLNISKLAADSLPLDDNGLPQRLKKILQRLADFNPSIPESGSDENTAAEVTEESGDSLIDYSVYF